MDYYALEVLIKDRSIVRKESTVLLAKKKKTPIVIFTGRPE
jgi:hypothetical protein